MYGIVKIIPFESHLKRMTVVVEQSNTNKLFVFCKGAPEQIRLHCDPSSIPADFCSALNHFSKMGYRIIGLAGKELSVGGDDVKTVGRDVLEENLLFYGNSFFQHMVAFCRVERGRDWCFMSYPLILQ